MMQSSSSDNCVHHSHTEISNFFDPKLRVNNTKAMIKNNLKALLSELKNFSQYQSQKYKKTNYREIFHLSVKPIASDSDINEVFKLIHQIISTKIKKSASND